MRKSTGIPWFCLAAAALAVLHGAAPGCSKKSGGGSRGVAIGGVSASITIIGSIFYERRQDDPARGSTRLPVRRARVEVLRLNDNRVLASSETDAIGDYELAITTPSESRLVVSVLSLLGTGAPALSVKTNTRDRLVYSFESAELALTEDPRQAYTVNLDLPLNQELLSAPFSILDTALRALERIAAALPPPPFPLVIFWEKGNPEGTFFFVDPALNLDGIPATPDPFLQINGGFPNPVNQPVQFNSDQFDDSVILHEFGHYTGFLYSRDDSPGGDHRQGEQLDPRLAWSEGWATFFSLAIKEDPVFRDTIGCNPGQNVCAQVELDYENKDLQGCLPGCCRGIGSEDAVTALLWDILDSTPNEAPEADPASIPLDDMLLAFAGLTEARFIYAGDYLGILQARLPAQAASIAALAARDGFIEGGALAPFPLRFAGEVRNGNQVTASSAGEVDATPPQACGLNIENGIQSSDFYEIQLPARGQVVVTLEILENNAGVDGANPTLRIFNQDQAFFFQPPVSQASAPVKTAQFSIGGSFPGNSPILIEVAGDTPQRNAPNLGQKARYQISLEIR